MSVKLVFERALNVLLSEQIAEQAARARHDVYEVASIARAIA